MFPARSHNRNTLTLHSVLFPWDTLFQHQFSNQGSATEFRVLEVTDFPLLLLGLEDFVSPVGRGDGQVKPPKDKNHRYSPRPLLAPAASQNGLDQLCSLLPTLPLFPWCGRAASILRTVVVMGPLVAQTFLQGKVCALWPNKGLAHPQPGRTRRVNWELPSPSSLSPFLPEGRRELSAIYIFSAELYFA